MLRTAPRLAALLLAALAAAPAALALDLTAPAPPVAAAPRVAPVAPVAPAPASAGAAAVEHLWIPSFDGVRLRATWFQPEGPGPFPLVLRAHGWAQVRELQPTGFVGKLLERGFAVLTWDARGFGESEGLVELDSPDYEVKDVGALLSWAAANKPVRLDGPGDPRAGMSGRSYGGGIQLLAAAFDPRVDAIVPEITWHDLRYSLGPNGVVKLGWVTLLYLAGTGAGYFGIYDPQLMDRFYPNAEGMDPVITQWLVESLAANRVTEAAAAGLAERSIASYLDLNPDYPPTMLVQGWRDTLFTPNEAVWTHAALRAQGAHASLLVHGGGHGYATPDSAAVDQRMVDFLDYWLFETTAPVPADVEVWLPQDQRWQVLGGWPIGGERLALGTVAPVGAGPVGALGGGAPGLVVVPATVAPAAFTEFPNFQESYGPPAVEAPGAAAVFATPPLSAARDVVGTPRLRLAFAGPVPDATLFVKVLDLAPNGVAPQVVGRQVTPLRVESGALEATVEVELTAIAHRFEEGHRLALAISASDAGFLASRVPLPVVLQADGSSWVEFP